LVVSGKAALAQKPADMAPPKAVNEWRVDVVGSIRMKMVVAMMCSPPQRPALHAGGAKQGKCKLCCAGGAKRLVRKIAVIKAGNGKHSCGVQQHGNGQRNG
jgi:hypothetical protein